MLDSSYVSAGSVIGDYTAMESFQPKVVLSFLAACANVNMRELDGCLATTFADFRIPVDLNSPNDATFALIAASAIDAQAICDASIEETMDLVEQYQTIVDGTCLLDLGYDDSHLLVESAWIETCAKIKLPYPNTFQDTKGAVTTCMLDHILDISPAVFGFDEPSESSPESCFPPGYLDVTSVCSSILAPHALLACLGESHQDDDDTALYVIEFCNILEHLSSDIGRECLSDLCDVNLSEAPIEVSFNKDTRAPADIIFVEGAPTQSPITTVALGKFEWDIERTGNVTAIFTDETVDEEIMLSYNISLRTAIVQIFAEDCSTAVTLDAIAVSINTDITSPTHGQLDVTLDVNENTIVGSNIWRAGYTTGEAFIDVCVRVDLVLDNAEQTSVNFHEQKLYLTLGLSRDFDISDIDLDRENSDVETQDVLFGTHLTACQCNLSADCVSDVLVQGDDIYVCVFSDSETDFVISAVEQLEFAQDRLRIVAIENSSVDVLTEVLSVGQTAIVRTQLRSEFFISSSPNNLIASGRVSIAFRGVKRSLRVTPTLSDANPNVHRAQQEEENDNANDGGFHISMSIARGLQTRAVSSNDGSSRWSIINDGLIIACTSMITCIALVAFSRITTKKNEKMALQAPRPGVLTTGEMT